MDRLVRTSPMTWFLNIGDLCHFRFVTIKRKPQWKQPSMRGWQSGSYGHRMRRSTTIIEFGQWEVVAVLYREQDA